MKWHVQLSTMMSACHLIRADSMILLLAYWLQDLLRQWPNTDYYPTWCWRGDLNYMTSLVVYIKISMGVLFFHLQIKKRGEEEMHQCGKGLLLYPPGLTMFTLLIRGW